jgi:hypothetical protein
VSDVTTIEADVPGRYADAVAARLRRAVYEDVVSRIWRQDGTSLIRDSDAIKEQF